MRMEKEVAKNGGMGGFFQLFDWSAKSRKKLFSTKSDLLERSKQGKRSDGNLPMTRLHLMDNDEHGAGSSIRSGEYSCASSVTDDDGYGARPAGVVAKLMGLDCMPIPEPSCNAFFDTQSLREDSHSSKQFAYYHEYQSMHSSDPLYREDCPPRKLMESRPRKAVSRPMEKFQTEMLPPKSAKSIPVTHHKLLSPIKRANFISSNTAAHIMEEAAKIIEPSPQTPVKSKMPAVGSSSAPLKVRNLKSKLEASQRMPMPGSSKTRDMKEKVESAQRTSRTAEALRRPAESSAAKCLKGQPLNKSWNGSADFTSSKISREPEEGSSSGQKNKGRSVSLAVQAKVNVQRREGLNPSKQKEQSEEVTSPLFRSQTNFQKSSSVKRQSSPSAYGVLRQNSQKQNCSMDKEKPSSKPSNSSRKASPGNPYGRPKASGKTTSSKYGTRKSGTDAADGEKGGSNCITKNTPSKKRSLDGNLQFDNNQAVLDNMMIDHHSQKEDECDSAIGKHFSWAEESKRSGGMDVVSFTFTAPLTRSTPGYETPSRATQKDNGVCIENRSKRLLLDTETMQISSQVGYNVVGGNDLSALLEQKLRELTDAVESSNRNTSNKTATVSNSSSRFQHTAVSQDADHNMLKNKDQNVPCPEKVSSGYGFNSFSADPVAFRYKPIFQGVDAMEECSSSSSKYDGSERLIDHRRPSPISVLEHSFSTESSCTLESMESSSTEGGKQCSSSIQAQEVVGLTFLKKHHDHPDADTELLDSASSTSTRTVSLYTKSSNCEVEYVKEVLVYLDLMFHDFAIGRCSEVVNPHLFNQLENNRNEPGNRTDEAKLEKKPLFDCISECLDLRCKRYISGGYSSWAKGVTVMSRKDRLAEEVHKDIVAWRKMGDCMVDELVDKDMSSQYGNWLDYEADAFGVGTEIESLILNSLVDELVADIRPQRRRMFSLGV